VADAGDGRHRTKQEAVVARLRDAILDEELAPGQWLRLRDLARMLGTSTMPIREALQVLASEGLVTLSPHRGAQVAPLSAEELEELFMARLGLDGLAARLGAQHVSDAELARMRALVEEMERAIAADDIARFLELDNTFHALHFGASRRPSLLRRIERLHKSCGRYDLRARILLADTEATRRFHADLIAACAAHDGVLAEQIIRQDIEATIAYIRQHVLGAPEVGTASAVTTNHRARA